MTKYLKLAAVLFLLVLGLYFMVKGDFMTGMGAFLGLTGLGAVALPKQPKLEEEAVAIKEKVADSDKKLETIKKEGVETKTSEEEVDYWKKQ
jgi:hypothetical protein